MEYIGNCVTDFDENCECINPELPWNDVTEFAQAVEEADDCQIGNIVIKYDEETDVHSFYRVGRS